LIWTVPILAILIGVWLAWDTLSREGPRITISFQDAEGLQAGQSQLKYKNITLGTVHSFAFTPDRRRVLVTIETTKQAEPMLTEGALFWVVKPRLFAGNISGFSTLISGAYIGMVPGKINAKSQDEFVGREDPPVLESDVPGRTFLLKTGQIGAVNLGSPIFFRGLAVGQVLGWDIGDMAENVTIHAFVRAPFDTYVHPETRFWNASGLSVKLGSAGVELKVESLRALLLGGIAFDTPAVEKARATTPENHVFPLFASKDVADAASYSRKINLLSYFSGSVRGLAPGADVTMHGLKVGQVTDVRLTYDAATDSVLAPVRFEIEPERVVGIGRQLVEQPDEIARDMVKKGLRATLQSTNLLTGEMAVALEVVPNAPPAELTSKDGDLVLPTASGGGLGGLQASAGELLQNVNAIPFASIGRNLDDIAKRLNDITNGPQLENALTSLSATMAAAQSAVQTLNTDLGPTLNRLPEIANSLQSTLKQSSQLMQSVQSGYGENTQFHRDLNRLMGQVTDALRSIRALADLLSRHPEALVRGRAGGSTE